MNTSVCKLVLLVVALVGGLFAQDPIATDPKPFDRVTVGLQEQLAASVAELSKLREQMAEETLPLSRELATMEAELVRVRGEFQQQSRDLDTRMLEVNTMRGDIKAREEQATFLSNMFGEYLRNFESRLHIAESDRYAGPISAARLAMENTSLARSEVYAKQVDLLSVSLDRVHDVFGGTRFEGEAVDNNGTVHRGSFVVLGPAALFRSADGSVVGTAEQRLGSLKPAVFTFGRPEDAAAASKVVADGTGLMPFDPTLGNAHKIEDTQETLWQHILAGGPVMWPILALAGAALFVVLYKWLSMIAVKQPNQRRVRALLKAIEERDQDRARVEAKAVGGPTGRMLASGVEHIDEPRELVEEVMYETVLDTKMKLQRFLPFVAISASSAPLLGLLGTVTGIMNTFKLITVFGTGDVKTLSSGISEALITTEYGLIVAIPSLLLHALLSRKAKSMVDQMEKAGIAFINQLGKTPFSELRDPEPEKGEHRPAEGRYAPAIADTHAARSPDLESAPRPRTRARELEVAPTARRGSERNRSAGASQEGFAEC